MALLHVEQYTEARQTAWDEFVQGSKNGTFLFIRRYLEYHRDRFQDYSLLICDDRNEIVALLPASRSADVINSHGGLTYGGFVTDSRMTAPMMLATLDATLTHFRAHGITRFIYKAVPYIYHRLPAGEDLYALFRHNAHLYRRDVSTAVIASLDVPLQHGHQQLVKKARGAGLSVHESMDFAQFWPILEWNLWTSHTLKPVHALAEMQSLHASFPNNIKLFGAYVNEAMVAGTVIYETPTVAHAQYTGTSEAGRSCGALQLLYYHLVTDVFRHKAYFDFGISTESDGSYLNEGLVYFKEGFGGRTVIHDFYELSLARTVE